MYFINGNRIIKIVLHVFSFPIEHYCSLVLHHWLIKLSKITKISLKFSFVAKSAAKVLLFFGLTKFLSNFFQCFLQFLRKWLIFSITFFLAPFAIFSRSLAFIAKSAAKVLLFCELTKYFAYFFIGKTHFLHKWLIFNHSFFYNLSILHIRASRMCACTRFYL